MAAPAAKQGLACGLALLATTFSNDVDHAPHCIFSINRCRTGNDFDSFNRVEWNEIEVDRVEIWLINPLPVYEDTGRRNRLTTEPPQVDGLLEAIPHLIVHHNIVAPLNGLLNRLGPGFSNVLSRNDRHFCRKCFGIDRRVRQTGTRDDDFPGLKDLL